MHSKNSNSHAVNVLNQLEGFAIFFANGAADEEVAFPVAAIPFCDYVEMFAPCLIAMRSNTLAGFTSGKYANTVRLYEIWADRIRVEEIEAQTKDAAKELGSLKREKIKIIGDRA